ncbi:MAG: glutamyl-tRNA reductase [Candidatus Latescibacteria bacterium]|jgi:glutamyl-tRNA reductase|nr:glutamyl-tRNA reductase [Candidatus Latescibacterota bacterium]
MPVVVLGLNHRTAPIEVRDAIAVSPHGLRAVLELMIQLPAVNECALISTCNRSEAYVVTDDPTEACRWVTEVLSDLGGMIPDQLGVHLYSHTDLDAVRHLFAVAAGLDSMIVGEPQIAGQVKDAGTAAMEARTSRVVLNRQFRCAVEASKRARTETEIGAGAVSVSYAAVELAKKIFGDLGDRAAFVIGAGEMSELTAKHLVESGVRSITVASRTLERAQELAVRVSGEALDWEDAMAHLDRADIVISSTSASTHVLHCEEVAAAMQRRRNRQMFLIDIAVPRDIEPEVGELYNVLLYNIDDLQSVVGVNLKKRQEEAQKARAIIEEEVAEFSTWQNSLEVVPAIVAIRQRFREVLDEELEHARLSGFTDEQRARVADLLRRYMNKLLHGPMVRLKAEADSGNGLADVDTLMRLFDLQIKDKGEAASEGSDQSAEEART